MADDEVLGILREIRSESAATKKAVNDLSISVARYTERTDNLDEKVDSVVDDVNDNVWPTLNCCVKFKYTACMFVKAFLALGGGSIFIYAVSNII